MSSRYWSLKSEFTVTPRSHEISVHASIKITQGLDMAALACQLVSFARSHRFMHQVLMLLAVNAYPSGGVKI